MHKCRYCGLPIASKEAEKWCTKRHYLRLRYNLARHTLARELVPIWPMRWQPAPPAPSLARRALPWFVLSVVTLAWVIIFGAVLWAVGEMVR